MNYFNPKEMDPRIIFLVLFSATLIKCELAELDNIRTVKGALCSHTVIENENTFRNITGEREENKSCKFLSNLNVTKRMETITDLAWFLTPRSYLLTNGNEFLFRSIHEALFEVCSPSQMYLQTMRTGFDFDLRNLILFAEPDWPKHYGSVESPYMHLICNPEVSHQLWSSLYHILLQLPVRDFPNIETALYQFSKSNPQLMKNIKNFGTFKCSPNPLCKPPKPDDKYCSPGAKTELFDKWEMTVTWTDRISDTTKTGSGFLVEGCLNGKNVWGLFSIVYPQSMKNGKAFKSIVMERGFKEEYFTFGKYETL